MMLQNYVWVKEPMKVCHRPMHFNAIEYKIFINMVSNFTLQLTFKKLIAVEFWSTVSETAIKIIPSSPIIYL